MCNVCVPQNKDTPLQLSSEFNNTIVYIRFRTSYIGNCYSCIVFTISHLESRLGSGNMSSSGWLKLWQIDSPIRDGGILFHSVRNALGVGTRQHPWHCQRLERNPEGPARGGRSTWVLINALKTKRPPSGLPRPHARLPDSRSSTPLPLPARDEEQSTTIAGQIQLAQFFICGSQGSDLADPFGSACCRLLLPWALAIVLGSGSLELWGHGATGPWAMEVYGCGALGLKVVYFEKSPSPDRGLCRRLGI